MIQSMTGYGSAQKETPYGRLFVEVRSVNNRFLEMNLRLGSAFHHLDVEVRNQLKAVLNRGKVDLTVRFDANEEVVSPVRINTKLLKSLLEQLQPFSPAPISPERLLSVPGVMMQDTTDLGHDEIDAELTAVIHEATEQLIASRRAEGEKLNTAFQGHHDVIANHLSFVDEARNEVVVKYKEKLHQRIEELLADRSVQLDNGRLELEVAIFADKADITEEVQRLSAHLQTLQQNIKSAGVIQGKALEFLSQEMLREINTMGSKCRDLSLSQTVLAMKQELESLRENLANVE
ncbi:MAG: YicC/YloC family endoribonuclease [Sumerlaeia bacterium]